MYPARYWPQQTAARRPAVDEKWGTFIDNRWTQVAPPAPQPAFRQLSAPGVPVEVRMLPRVPPLPKIKKPTRAERHAQLVETMSKLLASFFTKIIDELKKSSEEASRRTIATTEWVHHNEPCQVCQTRPTRADSPHESTGTPFVDQPIRVCEGSTKPLTGFDPSSPQPRVTETAQIKVEAERGILKTPASFEQPRWPVEYSPVRRPDRDCDVCGVVHKDGTGTD